MLKIINHELESHVIRRSHLSAKEFLFHQGQLHRKLYVLQSGWMLLIRTDETGKRQILKLVLPGEVFGFQPDLQGPAIYSAVALRDSTICSIPHAFELCKTHPELAMRLAWASACDMLLLEMYLEKIGRHSASERIAFLVLEIFRRLKQRGLNNGYSFPFPLRQEDIADMLLLTPIHVNRTLHTLKEQGLFAIDHYELTIFNYDGLVELVGSGFDMYLACELSEAD